MTVPAPPTDREILDALKPLLTQAFEHGGDPAELTMHPADRLGTLPADLTRTIRWRIDQARRLGITPRRIASHCRVPGLYVIRWFSNPAELAAAYAAEIHHLEREAAAVRRTRARYVRALVTQDLTSDGDLRAPMTKTAAAATFKVSRPTIDAWLEDAADVSW